MRLPTRRSPAARPARRRRAPLYLRRFRARGEAGSRRADGADDPLWRRAALPVQQALTEDNRNKEISARRGLALRNDVYLIRHGETQGYSTDSGLTPRGVAGPQLRPPPDGSRAARPSSSATPPPGHETAEQIHRGLVDGLAQYEKSITVEPGVADEFRNFQFVAPDGLKDVTAAFREYQSLLEGFERSAARDRPQWVGRWTGRRLRRRRPDPALADDPDAPPSRRRCASAGSAINRLSAEFLGARLAISTHSGCIRASPSRRSATTPASRTTRARR